MTHEASRRFFDGVVKAARETELLSDEHFTVDGTLIEAWAPVKSLRPRDEAASPPDEDSGNPTVDFRGEKRSNAPHVSRTGPDSRWMRKGTGKEAKPCYGFHALMENRSGLVVEVEATRAGTKVEREAALMMVDRFRKKWRRDGAAPQTLGADKGCHAGEFVRELLRRKITPHVAMVTGRKTDGLDGRTLRSAGYRLSQRIRKRVEEIFGWMKRVGGLRKTRFRELARFGEQGAMTAAAYNLMRLGRMVV